MGGNAQQLPHLGGQRSLDVPLLRPLGPEPVLRHLGPALLQAVEGDRQAGEGPAEEEEVAAEESRLIGKPPKVDGRQKFVVLFFFNLQHSVTIFILGLDLDWDQISSQGFSKTFDACVGVE